MSKRTRPDLLEYAFWIVLMAGTLLIYQLVNR